VAEKPGRALPARAAVVPLPPRTRSLDPELVKLLPGGRSILVGLLLAVLGVGAYLVARESSMFAVETVQVEGAPAGVAGAVRAALRPFVGKSLVSLDGRAVDRTLDALPVVASARYDRNFPHTLRVFVRPELAVAVLRRGPESWLVSARGRVMARLERRTRLELPRIWVPRSVTVTLGSTVSGEAAEAIRAVVPLRGTRFGRRVASAGAAGGALTLVLHSGLELRLGDDRDLLLKLAVGRRIVHLLGPATGYVDLSVPGRPVSAANPRVAG
jgi:cell division protein FtsQ